MRSISFYSVLVFTSLFLACNTAPAESPDEVVPEEETLETDGTSDPSFVYLSELDMDLYLPEGYVVLSTSEGAGSYLIEYEVESEYVSEKSEETALTAIRFSNEDSVNAYWEACKKTPTSTSCKSAVSPGGYSSEKNFYEFGQDGPGFKYITVNGENYLLSSTDCEDGDCTVLTYTSFIDELRMDILVSTASALEEDEALASDLVAEVRLEEGSYQTFALDYPELDLVMAEGYKIKESTEYGRRGSFVSYDLVSTVKGEAVSFQEVQFFDKDSIIAFAEECAGGFCFAGDYHTLEEFLADGKPFSEDYHVIEDLLADENSSYELFNEWPYIVSTFDCSGDSCAIREYSTYLGDMRMDVWITLPEGVTEEAIAEADELFSSFSVRFRPRSQADTGLLLP